MRAPRMGSGGIIPLALLVLSISVSGVAEEVEEPRIEVFQTMQDGPGNLTVTMDARVMVSLHPFFAPHYRVVEVTDSGELIPFPNEELAVYDPDNPLSLNSVLGIQADQTGVVWMLDNALRDAEASPKLLGWNHFRDELDQVVLIDPEALVEDSFLNDLAVDRSRQHVYIADPAGGADAALVVVNLRDGSSRRVLEGHLSVVPEDVDLVIDGYPLEVLLPDGEVLAPRVGVNPIALDPENEWLYFGPMHGTSLYRIPADSLADPDLSPDTLASLVERYAAKPISDGISIDRDNNIYLGDLAANSIVRITPDRSMEALFGGPRFSWIDAFSYGPDGTLYTLSNQLHRTPRLNRGVNRVVPPHPIFRIHGVPPGVAGR